MEVKTVLKSWGPFGEEDPLNRSPRNMPVGKKTAGAGQSGAGGRTLTGGSTQPQPFTLRRPVSEAGQ